MSDLAPTVADAVERLAYRPAEAAAALGLSRARIYELMAEGQLTYRQIGGVRLIPRTAIDALLADPDEANPFEIAAAAFEASDDEPA